MAVAECGIRENLANITVKKAPPPDSKEWEGKAGQNSNTSYQIQARVIEADSSSAVVYGGADTPLTGPIPEGRTFFCPHCGALLFGDVFAAFQE